jgi:hypothetical protein
MPVSVKPERGVAPASLSHRSGARHIMKTQVMSVFISLLALGTALSAPARCHGAYPPEESLEQVRARIDAASKEHPRLLATADDFKALRETLDKDPTRRMLAQAVIAQANELLRIEPIERQLQGRRLLDKSRQCVKRVLVLAMAYRLTDDARFLQRCETEMVAAAEFADWNPSHFLDVAEMTFALAIGYDWLYSDLDQSRRDSIRDAIVNQGVILPWTTRHKGWVRSTNNWGQVCHGGLTAGALAVMEDEPELAAKTVHNAIHNVTRAMEAYRPRGSYPEGPGYWAYGTSYNVVLIAALESALGTAFGLTEAPGFEVTGHYLPLVTGPSGQTFNYADGGAGRSPQACLFWFADRFNRPDWLLGELDRLRSDVARLQPRHAASSSNRMLPLALLWMKGEQKQVKIEMPLHWSSGGETPITIHRSSWSDPNATFVGVKAGSPSANHGQMDIGAFVLDADGVRWGLDLGAEGYHGIESRGMNLWGRQQHSDRWKIFRQCNAGHSTLVIDGKLQQAAGHADVTAFSDDPGFPHTIVDMTQVYGGQADNVRRGVALLPSGEMLVQDELQGKPGTRIRWGMVTQSTTEQTGETQMLLREGNRRLVLRLLGPRDADWQVVDASRPRNDWDSPNPGTSVVAFEATIPDSGSVTLAVVATPGTCRDSVAETLEIQPLVAWKNRGH